MHTFKSLFTAGLVLALQSGFGVSTAHATFIPDGEMRLGILSEGEPNIAESEFNEILGKIQARYAPVAASHGGTLAIEGDWKSSRVDARATQFFGTWRVRITGALARRPELSPDALALIVCHEVGHHLGGFPFIPATLPFMGVWGAAEGEADYFSTHVCARQLWAADLEKNAGFAAKASEVARAACDSVWKGDAERNLCYRTTTAAQSVTATMAALMKKPVGRFETPDPAVVEKTKVGHPAVQCRMDTTLAGALCTAAFDEKVIPGKKVPGGSDGIEAEREAAMNSCTKTSGYSAGLRPTCWFKPRL